MYHGKFANHSGSRHYSQDRDPDENLEYASETTSENEEYQEQWEENYEQPIVKYKRKWLGTVIGGALFYFLLIAAIVSFSVWLNGRQNTLIQTLSDYEQLQPKYVSQQIFSELFEKPDWGKIYDEAQGTISEFEGRDAYISYMEQKAGNMTLVCNAIPVEENGKLTYTVSAEDEKIASFSIRNNSSDPTDPDWQMDSLQIFFKPQETFYIRCGLNQAVKVNGVQLDESFTVEESGIRLKEDLGELSAHVSLPGARIYEISGLLVKPSVIVEDRQGSEKTVTYDEASHTFSVSAEEQEIPEEARSLALSAVKTYCEFMINKASRAELAKYFKQDSRTFWAITDSDLTWIQEEKNHSIADEQVYDYVRLSEKAFAVRVSLTWQLVRKDDSIKKSPVDETLIFEQEPNGNWRCSRMTGKKLVEPYKLVRVRFLQQEKVLSSQMMDPSAAQIVCPLPEHRSHQVPDGWAAIYKDENGKDFYQRVLDPDEKGTASVPNGLLDHPVDLKPIYVNQ